jgi:pimeloyl-ACP methyl ester carboxylesterase
MADLSFEEVSTGFVAVKFAVADALGNHIAYTDSGNVHSTEPVVIFIPGVGDIRAQYRFFAPRFEKSHRVITTDLRGVGDSDVGFDSYTAKDVGEDIMRIILQEDITPEQGVILVGSSIGAVAAQWYVNITLSITFAANEAS